MLALGVENLTERRAKEKNTPKEACQTKDRAIMAGQ